MISSGEARKLELARQLELARSDPEAAAAIAATLAAKLPTTEEPQPEPEPEPEPRAGAGVDAEIDEQQRRLLLQQRLEQVRADPNLTASVAAELFARPERSITGPATDAPADERRPQLEQRLAEARSSEVRAAEMELELSGAQSAGEQAAEPSAAESPAAWRAPELQPEPAVPSMQPSAPTAPTPKVHPKRKPGLFACCGAR